MFATAAACALLTTTIMLCRRDAVPKDLRPFAGERRVAKLEFLPTDCSTDWLASIAHTLGGLLVISTPNCCFNCAAVAESSLARNNITMRPERSVIFECLEGTWLLAPHTISHILSHSQLLLYARAAGPHKRRRRQDGGPVGRAGPERRQRRRLRQRSAAAAAPPPPPRRGRGRTYGRRCVLCRALEGTRLLATSPHSPPRFSLRLNT